MHKAGMLLYDSWWIFALMLVACGVVGLLLPQSLWWLVILLCAGISIVGNVAMHRWHAWRNHRRWLRWNVPYTLDDFIAEECERDPAFRAALAAQENEGGDGDAE